MKRFASVPNRPGLKIRANREKSPEGTERPVKFRFNPFQRVSHREPGLQSRAGWNRSESTRRTRVDRGEISSGLLSHKPADLERADFKGCPYSTKENVRSLDCTLLSGARSRIEINYQPLKGWLTRFEL